jgi:hypothetical protein
MYGISILSLVSTASRRNWSVFLFLEEEKENSVSLGTLHTQLWERGSLAPEGNHQNWLLGHYATFF